MSFAGLKMLAEWYEPISQKHLFREIRSPKKRVAAGTIHLSENNCAGHGSETSEHGH